MAELSIAPGRRLERLFEPAVAPVVAAVLAVGAVLVGAKGKDLPAALYRISLFHRHGLTVWDSQWYGGHWTLDYSVIFPPVAGILGVHLTEVGAVALAALAFDRLAVGALGRSARVGSIAFALGTLVQVAIGQLPFLLGEAFGLCALWAAYRERRWVAALLAACAALASPLAGAFVGLAAAAWLLSDWRRHLRVVGPVVAAALVPVGALSLLFPGQGAMPFPFKDWAFSLAVYALAAALLPRRARIMRIACALYLVAFVLSFVLRTPVGGNIERLGEAFGPAVVAVALWPVRRAVLAVVAVPLIILQWGPALAALSTDRADPSTRPAYYAPLVRYLSAHEVPSGRVEIVPTSLHWEAAYAAPAVELARGWERQLDTANNPLFYGGSPLTSATYYDWLVANGVRYVALPDAKLDYAGKAEGALVGAGVPGLVPVWHNSHWRVFGVAGSPGIVSGPATAVEIDGGELQLDVHAPGAVLVRVRYTPHWSLASGAACLSQGPGGWLRVQASAPGPVHITMSLVGAGGHPC